MLHSLHILFAGFIGDLKQTTRGFVKKDLEKVQALNSIEGVTCLGVTFSDEIEQDYFFNPQFEVKKVERPQPHKFFGSWYKSKTEHKSLEHYLDTHTSDVVIFRYDIASLSLYKLVKKHKNKIIFEHNSFEYDEHALGIRNRRALLKFSLKPGYFLYYLEGKAWPLFCEKFLGPRIRSKALAGISVTNEIAAYQEQLASGYTNRVITNGIHYNKELIHAIVPYNGRELKLFMLLGTGAQWHGVDRLLNGLKNYKGKLKITLDIIGYYSEEDFTLAHSLGLTDQVKFFEPILGETLDQKIATYHISIGTLAVHRKNLKEATPLKVRDALMRGFPVIIAYDDTDFLKPLKINDFILKLAANDLPIDFNLVEAFADKVLRVENYPQVISEAAQPVIDFKVKAQQTVNFIRSMQQLN